MNAVVILGPTAVGKSRLAGALAGPLGGEICSVDSRQAYRHVDIGTAKPTPEEQRTVRHHLIDILELHEKNNAALFADRFWMACRGIIDRGKTPILVGGSGLYLRAILKGFFSLTLGARERASFGRTIDGTPTNELYKRLEAVDTESAQRIHTNDRYRIVRALEVYTLTGVPLSEHFKRAPQETVVPDIDFTKVGLELPRDELYRRINARTVRMIESGWVEEVERLIEGGADPAWPGMKTLGYPEIIAFLRDEISREQMIERIARQTRQYAKRQCTWFRGEEGVRWFRADGDITQRVLEYVT